MRSLKPSDACGSFGSEMLARRDARDYLAENDTKTKVDQCQGVRMRTDVLCTNIAVVRGDSGRGGRVALAAMEVECNHQRP